MILLADIRWLNDEYNLFVTFMVGGLCDEALLTHKGHPNVSA